MNFNTTEEARGFLRGLQYAFDYIQGRIDVTGPHLQIIVNQKIEKLEDKEALKNPKQKMVEYLKSRSGEFVSPSEIAQDLFNRYSSYSSPHLIKLVDDGVLERNDKGHYRYKENQK